MLQLNVAYKDPNDPRSAAAKRRHYLRNKDRYKQQAKENTERIRQWVRELKESSPCSDCNQHYPYYVMQYDHVGVDKKANISRLVRNGAKQKIVLELEKCELVCANCHAERTHKRISDSVG